MCDTIAAIGSATRGGTVLFAKNSDRDHTEAQHLQMLPAARHETNSRVRLTYVEIDQAAETNAVLLSRPHWIWGAEIGANSHGLVVGNEAIFSRIEASLAPGVIGMDYVRLALERARNVDEGIHVITTLLREHGQSGNCGFRRVLSYHNSFMLADYRTAKVLETVDREWVVRPVTDFFAISNAMTIEDEFEAASPLLRRRAIEAGLYAPDQPFSFKAILEDPARTVSGHHRRARATMLLKERNPSIGVPDLFHVLRDHEEGPRVDGRPGARICAHRRENPIGQTTASWVADLTPGKTVHWVTATAAACTGIFKPVIFETALPKHGPVPGAEPDEHSLWWRHEQLRSKLEVCGATLAEAYVRERDQLESRFLDELGKCPSFSDVRSLEQVHRAIENSWRDALEFERRWHQQCTSAPHVTTA
jgi:secernin